MSSPSMLDEVLRRPDDGKRPHPVGARMVLGLVMVMVAAALAGLVALVGVAAVSDRPPLFLTAGLVVFLAVAAVGVALATRRLPAARRSRTRLVTLAVGGLVGVAVFVVTVLVPVGDPRLAPAPVAGQRFWQLPTGSRIAWVHLPAPRPRRPTPVVFLHGGPGIADLAGDAAAFGQLTGDGYDVFIYDQVGTGRSNRLQDPRGSTIARQVADLEAIRQQIRADRLALIGHSWADPGPPWPAWPRRRWCSRGPATTCPGAPRSTTARPCPTPAWSTSTMPGTTPTGISRPPTWPWCGCS